MRSSRNNLSHFRRISWASFAIAVVLSLASTARTSTARADLLPGFVETPQFEEQERWARLDSGIRLYVNTPRDVPAANRTLVVYATPNACTIEQTLGCAGGEGLSWRFGIQHVAGQVRRLRQVDPGLNLMLAIVQPPRLAW